MCHVKITYYKCSCTYSREVFKIPCKHASWKALFSRNWYCPADGTLTEEQKKPEIVEKPDECTTCAAESKRTLKKYDKDWKARERKQKKNKKEKKKTKADNSYQWQPDPRLIKRPTYIKYKILGPISEEADSRKDTS